MHLESKKAPLVMLAITALVLSRALFALFNDPEGPNLLIVAVAAAIIYAVSLAAYYLIPSAWGTKRLLSAVVVQIIVILGLYGLGLVI